VEDWGSEVGGGPPGGKRNAIRTGGGVVGKFDSRSYSLDVGSRTIFNFPVVTPQENVPQLGVSRGRSFQIFSVQKIFTVTGGDRRGALFPNFGPKLFRKGGLFRAGGGRGVVGREAEGVYLGPRVGNFLRQSLEGICLGFFLRGEGLDNQVASGILEPIGDPAPIFENHKLLKGGVEVEKAVDTGEVLGGGEDLPEKGLVVGQAKGKGVVGNFNSPSGVGGLKEGFLKFSESGKAGAGELWFPFFP